MIFITCPSDDCGFVARIHVDDVPEADSLIGPGSDWYPDNYPCPRCGEKSSFNVRSDPMSRFTDLTPKEAFVAFSGVGLPSEQECSASKVRTLLLENKIKDVTTKHINGTSRCLLETIELDNGMVLYLGSSALGACVYRVKEPKSYVTGK